jgi:hypothetical protein
MKKLFVLIVMTIIGVDVFANTGGPEYVRVSDVYCAHDDGDWFTDGEPVAECVVVELTSAGLNYMDNNGYRSVVVEVSPANSIWSFVIDLRKSKQVTITKGGYGTPRAEVCFDFRTKSSCGRSDFNVRVVRWNR